MPPIHDAAATTRRCAITTEDGWDMADRLAREEALHVGHSAGAAVFAALDREAAPCEKGEGGCVVTIVPDRGDRYFAPMKWEKRTYGERRADHPWTAGAAITRAALDAVEADALAGYARDEEACGYLRGPADATRSSATSTCGW